jgi:hypothetical protein
MWNRFLIAVTLLAAGCSEMELDLQLGSCRSMAESYVACMAPELDVAVIDRRCLQYSVDFKELKTCGAETNCANFKSCVLEFRQHAMPERRIKRLQDYIENRKSAESEGNYLEAEAACQDMRTDPDPIIEELKTCESLPRRAHDALRAKMRLLRDLPRSRFGHLALCAKYRLWAGRISPKAALEAEVLCQEAEASIEVFALVKEVRQRITDRDYRVPPHCATVVKRLSELGTKWATQLRPVVLDTCYVKLGTKVLAEQTSGRCSADTRRILAAATLAPERVAKPLQKLIQRVEDDCQ